MSTRDQDDEQSLSEAQRIQMLEKSMSLNRIILLFMGILAVVSLSVSITWMLLTSSSDDPLPALEAKINTLEESNATLQAQLDALKAQVQPLTLEIPKIKALATNGSGPALQTLMIEQEKSHQQFLKALKTGMYDLARMVPGSRTWLDIYGQQVDSALRASIDRMRRLQRLRAGEDTLSLN